MPVTIDPAVYPLARKDETIIDNFHGIKVADPYRWMEDPDAQETKKFVADLNAVSVPFLQEAPSREVMTKKLKEMWNFEKYGCISKRGNYYYYYHNTGLQNQYVLYQQKDLSDKGSVFIDPNLLNPDGTTSIRVTTFSKDGSIFAYALSEKGSDWLTVKFKTAEGEDLPDVITGAKHTSLSFLKDNSGIFYCKYPDHKGDMEGTSTVKHEFHSLYFHKMGTDCSEDILVYERRDDPNYMIGGLVTNDGRFLIIDVSRGCDPFNMLYYYDLAAVNYNVTGIISPVALYDKFEAKYDYVDHDVDSNSFFLQTNKNASQFRLIKIDWNNPSKFTEVIPEQKKSKLDWVVPLPGNRFLVSYLEEVKTALYVYTVTGELLFQIPIGVGTISGIFAKKEENEVFFQFESFLVPGVTYRLDFTNRLQREEPEMKEYRRVTLPGLNEENYIVEQVYFESKDNTKIPMFIISRKDIVKDGSNATLLNGYGGFNIADTPSFSITRLFFMEHLNGMIACPGLRGGCEYGEDWHIAGMRQNKQNVFDDMQAAAEYLINKKYTSPAKLAIHGASNGGLLMAAVSQQRPDLFGAVINRVGVLDMLRFHRFTIGGAWVPEFGNPDHPEDFKYIYKYSPLHNLKMPENGQWPSTILLTADHDDRVVPLHTLKYTARLLELAKKHPLQKNPLLARIEVNAGHGSGKPTIKVIEEFIDIYSFLQRVLDLTWKD